MSNNTAAQPTIYEIHVNKAIPTGNFADGPNVVRLMQPSRNAVDGNQRLLCGYLHIPNTQHLLNVLRSIEGYSAVFREAESRGWYPAGDHRADLRTSWNQKRIMRMFFPLKGNTSICNRFSIIRQNVGLDRQPTIQDLTDAAGRYVFSQVDMPAVGQAMAVVQIMARLPHLFRHSSNVTANATGQPVYNAEDVHRASCLLRCARKAPRANPSDRRRAAQNAIALEYAFPEGPTGTSGNTPEEEAAWTLMGLRDGRM